MKRTTSTLIVSLFALSAVASQVHFNFVDAATNPITRQVTITPASKHIIQLRGPNTVVQPTITVTNGTTTNVAPASYKITLAGFTNVLNMEVPDTNVVLEARDIITNLVTYTYTLPPVTAVSTNDPRALRFTNSANVFAGDGSGLTGIQAGFTNITGSGAAVVTVSNGAVNIAVTGTGGDVLAAGNNNFLGNNTFANPPKGDGSLWTNLPGPINPVDFGADPAGIADSTAAFTNAINAASNTLREVKIPAGFFRLSQTLTIPDGMTFSGSGAGNGTSYYPSATTLFSYASNAPIITLRGATFIRDMRIWGGATNDGSIGILIPSNTFRAKLDNVVIARCQVGGYIESSYCIDLFHPGADTCGTCWIITNGCNQINFFGGRSSRALDNIQITGPGRNINFYGHNSEKAGRHCLAITNYTGILYSGGYLETAYAGSEAAFNSCSNVVFDCVTFTDSQDYEVMLDKCTNATVKNCSFGWNIGQKYIGLANCSQVHEENNSYPDAGSAGWRSPLDVIWWSGVTTTPTLTMSKSGNLGINVASPGFALDVNGSGSVSGNLSIGGTLSSAGATPPRQAIAWYAPSGLTVSGPNVTGWTDASGNGHNAVNQDSDGNPANAPTNVVSGYGGLPAVQFGYSNLLSTPLNLSPTYARPYTLYFLFRPLESFRVASYSRNFFDGSYNLESSLNVYSTPDLVYSAIGGDNGDAWGGVALTSLTDAQWTNNWHVFSVCYNSAGSSNYAQLDTTAYRGWLATSIGRTARAFSIGNNQPGTNGLPMLLSQVLICQGAHNSNDMATVRQWLLNSSNSASGLQIAGNVNQTGTNTATAFAGDGSLLTNVSKVLASGSVILSGGSNLVMTSAANTSNRILLGYNSLDGTLNTYGYGRVTNGASFCIFTGSSSDTNQIDWTIVKP